MKSNTKWAAILAFTLNVFFIDNSIAQTTIETDVKNTEIWKTYPIAVFQNRNAISIDEKSGLSEYYIAKIDHLNFKSSDEATAFFDLKTDNLLSYQIDQNLQFVLIRMNTTLSDPKWKANDWIQYLNSKLNN